MNTLIQELVSREMEEYLDGAYSKGSYAMDQLTRFAESIIIESVSVALEQKALVEEMQVFSSTDKFWNEARIQQSQRIADKILEHFGIK